MKLYDKLNYQEDMDLLVGTMIRNSSEDDSDPDHVGGVAVAPVEPKLKKPSLYQVVMLNDDYTPMDFVVEVLQIFFGMDVEGATRVMLAVHTQGKGVCGVFTKDIAETKAAQVNQFARTSEHPLVCEIEAVED